MRRHSLVWGMALVSCVHFVLLSALSGLIAGFVYGSTVVQNQVACSFRFRIDRSGSSGSSFLYIDERSLLFLLLLVVPVSLLVKTEYKFRRPSL